MSIYGTIVQERYIINEKDIYYNKEKFDNGEINLCFITGQSGSGKSTMAKDIANKDSKVEHYELDDVIWNKESFTMENFKEYGELIYTFFNTVGKKYYYTIEDVKEGKCKPYRGNYEEDLIKDFVDYTINFSKSHKNTKYVIEGIWLFLFIEPEKLKDYAVYIKGTSALLSKYRASKRDAKEKYPDDKIKRSKEFLKRFISDHNSRFELKVQKYRKYFKNLMKEWIL